jgi:hypothetical protein
VSNFVAFFPSEDCAQTPASFSELDRILGGPLRADHVRSEVLNGAAILRARSVDRAPRFYAREDGARSTPWRERSEEDHRVGRSSFFNSRNELLEKGRVYERDGVYRVRGPIESIGRPMDQPGPTQRVGPEVQSTHPKGVDWTGPLDPAGVDGGSGSGARDSRQASSGGGRDSEQAITTDQGKVVELRPDNLSSVAVAAGDPPGRDAEASVEPEDDVVATMLRTPPDWLVRQLPKCREEPFRFLSATACTIAHEALGNPRRYEEVLPLLRAHLES